MSKLINLGHGDNMDYSLIKGHVTDEEFNKAWLECWKAEPLGSDEISHEYWVENKNGSWKSSTKDDPKAQPVTVTDW